MATHAMWWGASRSFFKKERLHPLLIMLPALIVIVFSVCARASVALKLIEDGAVFRTGYILLFLSCAFYQLAIAKEFISYRSPRLITSVSVGCAFALVAVLSLFKVITVPESLPPLMISPTTYSMATFVMVAFIQVVSMFGLMLISAERLQFRLHELAQSDPLTGLLNRRGFKLQSEVAIKRRRQGDNICAIMAFDLDHFKLVNDTYGHATGDDVLIAFANCLTENTRATDIIARFGGEEFIVLCIDVDQADAKKTAKRISEFMAALTIQSKNEEDVSITVSIGMAMIEEDSPDINLYLDTADTALYNAKARGRNKVVVAEPSAQFSVVI
jgi:diguanylate cyclase (GGDEF)-like protein